MGNKENHSNEKNQESASLDDEERRKLAIAMVEDALKESEKAKLHLEMSKLWKAIAQTQRAQERSSKVLFSRNLDTAQKAKNYYEKKLEETKESTEIFKYLVLIDISALETYINQTRIQAQESFSLSKWVAIAGFILILAGVSLGIITSVFGAERLDVAYLASLAGILTEFISGVFFFLFNRTLQQMNVFHDKLMESKKEALNYLATNLKESK